MKETGHPKVNKVIFHDTASGAEFITTSVLKSEETRKIGSTEYFVLKVETSSASHPFYTGTQTKTSKGGEVERFKKKMEAAKKIQEAKQKKVKGAKKEDLE